MEPNTFGKLLTKLREEQRYSMNALADAAKVSVAHISRIETGERPAPSAQFIKKLANVIGHYEELMKAAGYLAVPPEERNINALPIIGTIRAGIPILAQESYDGYLDVPDSLRADFALRVTGDSMIGAGILDGDYAICRESQEPQTGQIVVALRDEGSTSVATLKFYFNGSGNPQLKAANPNYIDIDYKRGYRCVGHMVALVRSDAPGYQTYRDYITVPGYEDWTEVIEKASNAGIKPEHLSAHVDMLIEMGKQK